MHMHTHPVVKQSQTAGGQSTNTYYILVYTRVWELAVEAAIALAIDDL